MRNSIKTEIKAWLISLRILIPLISVFAIFVFFVYASYKTFSITNSFLLNEQQIAIKRGSYDEYMLSMTDTSRETGYNSEYFINELKTAESHLHAIKPEHTLSYCMEIGYFFFPLLMTIIGAYTVKKDISSNLMRLRVAREGRWHYYFAKQIVLCGAVFASVIIGIVADWFVSALTYGNIIKKELFSMIDVLGTQYPNLGNNIGQISFFALYIFVFLEFGFNIALLTKSVLAPTLFAVVLFYFTIPYKYTLFNAVANVITKLCDFQGAVNFTCIEINNVAVILIIAGVLFVPFFPAICIFKHRSVYK